MSECMNMIKRATPDFVPFITLFQIVRADLKELNDMNLHGAPYAYTPFCDSRKEMDGFRCDTHYKTRIKA